MWRAGGGGTAWEERVGATIRVVESPDRNRVRSLSLPLSLRRSFAPHMWCCDCCYPQQALLLDAFAPPDLHRFELLWNASCFVSLPLFFIPSILRLPQVFGQPVQYCTPFFVLFIYLYIFNLTVIFVPTLVTERLKVGPSKKKRNPCWVSSKNFQHQKYRTKELGIGTFKL